jgi:hypothetical protein
MSGQDPNDKSEMRLTGLILTQSALIGAAVGVFDAGIWLPGGSDAGHYVNGITYSMGALAIQILAYYLFKMFFEDQMQEKVRVSEMQRQRDYRFREQQFSYDQRRADMELRMQEMQLEKELMWMQNNPGQVPPSQMTGIMKTTTSQPTSDGSLSMGLDSLSEQFITEIPVTPRIPPSENIRTKKDGTPDMRYKKTQ